MTVRPWAKDAKVVVVCGLCRDRKVLAQVEADKGQLFWHVEYQHKAPRFAIDGGYPPKKRPFYSNYVPLELVVDIPAAFRVRCAKHITASKDEPFVDLKEAVLRASRQRGRSVVTFPSEGTAILKTSRE